jgi:phosphoglycerate dehydrogenase-like enzyme
VDCVLGALIGSLVSEADILNLQIPLYPSTIHLMNDEMLAKMKRERLHHQLRAW